VSWLLGTETADCSTSEPALRDRFSILRRLFSGWMHAEYPVIDTPDELRAQYQYCTQRIHNEVRRSGRCLVLIPEDGGAHLDQLSKIAEWWRDFRARLTIRSLCSYDQIFLGRNNG
jgi:hypothetical protein